MNMWNVKGQLKIEGCNCGEHTAAYCGCEVSKREQAIQRVMLAQGITYAEAATPPPTIQWGRLNLTGI